MPEGRTALRTVRRRLDEWLFPDTPARPGGGRGEYALAAVAALALATIAELLRPGLAGSIHTLWAEDSAIFMQGAVDHGIFDAVLTVYPEYLVVGPRLIAGFATLFPLRDAAFVVSLVSAFLIALSGFVIWVASAGLIRNPYLRATLAIVTVLAPVSGLEAVDSASYIAWYMLVASFWLLLYRPRSTWGAALAGLFLLFTGLSNPGLWFFAPLAGLRLLAVRDRRDVIILSGYAIACAAQVVASLQHPSTVASLWTNQIWTVLLQRVIDGSVLGLRWGGELWAHLGWPLLIVLLALVVAGFAIGFWRAGGRARLFAGISIAIALLTFFVSIYERGVAPVMVWPEGTHVEQGGRYVIVPAMLVIGAALVLIDDRLRRGGRLPSWVAGGAIAILLVATASSFWLEDTTARGNSYWTTSYDAAKRSCEERALEKVKIHSMPLGFDVSISCERLTSNAAVAEPAPHSP